MQFKSFMEALKGNQHKLDKNKNGKLDAHDFKLLQKEEDDIEEGVDRVERADFKTNPSGRKSHKEITFKNGEPETDEIKAKSQREEVEMEEAHQVVAKTKEGETFKSAVYPTKKQAMDMHYKMAKGNKYAKVDTVKVQEETELDERSMTDAEMKKREDYVKGMKKNVAGFKAKYGERAKDVMYATATKMAMKEELDEALDPSEIASNPKMYDAADAKKAYYHKSASASDKESLARHLDRHHGNKEWRKPVKEEVKLTEARRKVTHENPLVTVHDKDGLHTHADLETANHIMQTNVKHTDVHKGPVKTKSGGSYGNVTFALSMHHASDVKKDAHMKEAFINGREYASHGLMHPDHAASALHKVTGQSIDFYAHGSGDKVEGKVTKNDGKAVHIKDTKGTTHKFKVQRGLPKQNNEELEMQEQVPVAPSLMKHRISVTVSDPDHTMVSKRKEKMQKTVVVTHSDNKEGAQKVGEKFYKKKGFIVHDSHHAGMVNEQKDPPFDGPYKKAEEPKTDKSGAVHSPMSRARHLARQAMKKQMKENFDLDISDEQADSLVEAATTEQLDELSKSTIGSYIKKAKTSAIGASQVAGMGSNIVGQKTADKAEKKVQKRASGINKAVDRLTREESNFDEEGNLMAEKLTFSDFIDKLNEQLLEYETKSGVYRHKGSYGSAYQGDDDDEDDKPKKAAAPDAPKRGRGRPAGSTGASYKPRSAETKAAAAAKAAATKAANKK